jgi:hypothetical protein
MQAPYPFFGGKSRIADVVWQAFGPTIPNYVEPFAGSAAVLLARPHLPDNAIETLNDADGFISNFYRAMTMDPEAVAYWADYIVSEADLLARHAWLVNRRARLTWCLEDPDWYDPKIAGWWLWGICIWIGSGWCSGQGPWVGNGAHIQDARVEDVPGSAGSGIKRKLPHLGDAGMGIKRQLPHLGDAGMGKAWAHLQPIAERLRNVRVCCGDWQRVLGPTPTTKLGTTAVFLDPPYSAEAGRDMGCYAIDCGDVAHAVREWCIANGDNPDLRIALCGYEGEGHEPLDAKGWTVKAWKTQGGYGSQADDEDCAGRLNSTRERVWFSPHCLTDHDLFSRPQPAVP